jgi:hypothetical protein
MIFIGSAGFTGVTSRSQFSPLSSKMRAWS